MPSPRTNAKSDAAPRMASRRRRVWWVAGVLLCAVGGVGLSYALAVNTEVGRREIGRASCRERVCLYV